MIREYAEDQIAENRAQPAEWSSWAGEMTGTDRYIAMRLLRCLNLRDQRDVDIAHSIARAYGLPLDLSAQSQSAREHWQRHHRNNESLSYISVSICKAIGERVERVGLDPLLKAIPESAFHAVA